jgi:hypothetical protein
MTLDSRRELAQQSAAKSDGMTLLSAALLISFMAPLLGSCGTSGNGASANASQSVPSSARGKRLTTVVNNGCTSDDDHLCALSAIALKVQLDKDLSEGGFFSAVTNDKPDFKLTVVLKKMEDDSLFVFSPDSFAAAAKLELTDNTGQVVFSGNASSNSGKAEEATKKLAADIAAKMKP